MPPRKVNKYARANPYRRKGDGSRGMNKTEKRYSEHLQARKITGAIIDWRYEPLKLRLADRSWFTPDFLELDRDGFITLTDVKAYRKPRAPQNGRKGRKGGPLSEDDAAVKVRVAAELHPWFLFQVAWFEPGAGWKVRGYWEGGGAGGEEVLEGGRQGGGADES